MLALHTSLEYPVHYPMFLLSSSDASMQQIRFAMLQSSVGQLLILSSANQNGVYSLHQTRNVFLLSCQ